MSMVRIRGDNIALTARLPDPDGFALVTCPGISLAELASESEYLRI